LLHGREAPRWCALPHSGTVDGSGGPCRAVTFVGCFSLFGGAAVFGLLAVPSADRRRQWLESGRLRSMPTADIKQWRNDAGAITPFALSAAFTCNMGVLSRSDVNLKACPALDCTTTVFTRNSVDSLRLSRAAAVPVPQCRSLVTTVVALKAPKKVTV
jgi:hypothetical protein